MWRVTILLIVLLASPAPAAIYQCRDAEGNLFLTDDPANFPPECESEGILVFDRETGEEGRESPDSPPPATEMEPSSAPAEPGPEPGGETGPGGESLTAEPPVERWLEEARELAREYREIQETPERQPAADPALSSAGDGPATEERLQQFEVHVDRFYERLEQAPLTPQERAQVEAELPDIGGP